MYLVSNILYHLKSDHLLINKDLTVQVCEISQTLN
jgi:hypothetical protein